MTTGREERGWEICHGVERCEGAIASGSEGSRKAVGRMAPNPG